PRNQLSSDRLDRSRQEISIYSAPHANSPAGVIIIFSVAPLIAPETSSASNLAANEMQRSIAQLSAKKKGSTFDFRAVCSLVFIINFSSTSGFKTTTRVS